MKKLIIGLLVLGIAVSSYGAERVRIRKFGGLNTRLNPYEIKESESPDMSNFVLDTAGSLTERNLFQHYNTATVGSVSIPNVYKFYKSSDVGYLIVSAGTRLYQATGNALNAKVTDNAVVSGSEWEFETFLANDGINTSEEVVFAANQGISLLTWNGTDDSFKDRATVNATDSGKPAENCNLLKRHKARLFAAGASDFPYRIYYSSLSNGIDWSSSGGTIDLPSYERIMKLEVLSDVLYLFTKTSIYALHGSTPNEFSILKTRSTVGTHATKSVALGNKLIIFLNKSGVFAFDGDTSTNISETIQPNIDSISSTNINDAASIYDNRGKYWLSYTSTTGSFNDTILIYDTVIKQWYQLDDINLDSLFKAEGGNDKGELFAGNSDNSGWLWQLQTTASTEQVSHATKSQLESGVTWNTTVLGTETAPRAAFEASEYYGIDAGLLLHLNGTDGRTDAIDYSPNSHAITFNGTARLDSEYRLGWGSLWIDGNSDYLSVPDSSAFDVSQSPSSNYTVDLWVKHDDHTGTEMYLNHGANSTDVWFLYHIDGVGLQYAINNGGSEVLKFFGGEITDTDWHHIALCKVGSEYGIYKDGEQVAYTDDSSTTNANATLWIGSSFGTGNFMDGNLDEIRIRATNYFNASPNSSNSDTIEYAGSTSSGTLHSANLEINASGQSALGAITWRETLPDNTDIQVTTRTGTTDDTVHDTWKGEFWVSTSTVVYDPTLSGDWTPNDATNFAATQGTGQPRNVDGYEDSDNSNPTCVLFTTTGAASTGDFADAAITSVDLSSYKFLGFWLKSPVTGGNVRLGIGEADGTEKFVTANTVAVNEWEYHYWPLANYTSTEIDAIDNVRITYFGDDDGSLYLGDIYAYDFLDTTETITSTPNDYIQYRAILGSTLHSETPYLNRAAGEVITLSYTVSGAQAEASIDSYWQSKIFDNNTDYNKLWQWAEFTLKSSSDASNDSVYLDYDLNDGEKTGTVTSNMVVTGRKTKMKFYLPTGSYGESLQLKVREEDLDSNLEIHNLTIRFIQEAL